jgi:hypothetical protein
MYLQQDDPTIRNSFLHSSRHSLSHVQKQTARPSIHSRKRPDKNSKLRQFPAFFSKYWDPLQDCRRRLSRQRGAVVEECVKRNFKGSRKLLQRLDCRDGHSILDPGNITTKQPRAFFYNALAHALGDSNLPQFDAHLHGRETTTILWPFSRPSRQVFLHYEQYRTHLSLNKDAPFYRPIQAAPMGHVMGTPQVCGLHRRYARRRLTKCHSSCTFARTMQFGWSFCVIERNHRYSSRQVQ